MYNVLSSTMLSHHRCWTTNFDLLPSRHDDKRDTRRSDKSKLEAGNFHRQFRQPTGNYLKQTNWRSIQRSWFLRNCIYRIWQFWKHEQELYIQDNVEK